MKKMSMTFWGISQKLEEEKVSLMTNGLLARLVGHFEHNEQDFTNRLEKICKTSLFHSRPDFILSLNRTATHHHNKKIKKNGVQEYLKLLSWLHLFVGVPIETFDLPESKYGNSSVKDLIEKYSKEKGANTETKRDKEWFRVLHIDSKDKDDYQKHMTEYADIVEEFLEERTGKLLVYDYLHRQPHQDFGVTSVYSVAHSDIYKKITKKVFSDLPDSLKLPFFYRRVLAAPIHINLDEFLFIHDELSEDDALKACIVKYSSYSLLEHILFTISKEPRFQERYYHSGFYCTKYPTRTYQFALCGTKDNEVYLEELSKYDRGECKPDLLIVGEANGRNKTSASQYRKDFYEYFERKGVKRFTLVNLNFFIKGLIKELNKKVIDLLSSEEEAEKTDKKKEAETEKKKKNR